VMSMLRKRELLYSNFSVNCRFSDCIQLHFKVKIDSAKVTDVHEARAGKMSDVIGEATRFWSKIAPIGCGQENLQ